ncbi:DapH/DapD/GlmU-related protein [Streptomyces sp. 8N114]|uniref:DapH/DapD/GlmU-related protein n=1 Tax=Streptomyces sp. 8N114 TaxID=3457419 RepID=UPI003FD60A61
MNSRIDSANWRALEAAGLLEIGTGCQISPQAMFEPQDVMGTLRPIRIHDKARIGAGAIVHGGTTIGEGARVEQYVTLGQPEEGYAVGKTYPGAGATTSLGAGAVLRAGATVYAGVTIGTDTAVGHATLIRSHSALGDHTLIGHYLVIERACRLGSWVRCSPLSHLTSEVVAEDRVFLGAGIRTINDKHLLWKDTRGRAPELVPPRFRRGAKVGTGSTILGGVEIGEDALIGAGSVVTRSIGARVTAYGNPARPTGEAAK